MVPLLAFGLSRVVADRSLVLGVLLLTPCIDYVIVFTGLAGGARARLLAAAPLLMLAQMLLLPFYLWVFAGREVLDVVTWAPSSRRSCCSSWHPWSGAALGVMTSHVGRDRVTARSEP